MSDECEKCGRTDSIMGVIDPAGARVAYCHRHRDDVLTAYCEQNGHGPTEPNGQSFPIDDGWVFEMRCTRCDALGEAVVDNEMDVSWERT